MAVSAVLRCVIDTTAVPWHIMGSLPCVTGFYGTFGYIFTICKLLWCQVCESLNLCT